MTRAPAANQVELLLALAMAMDEVGQVTPGKGGLLVRDRIQRDLRAGENRLAIFAGDGVVFGTSLGGVAWAAMREAAAPILCRGFDVDALCFIAAMIDPRLDIELGQAVVDMLGPTLALLLEKLGAMAPGPADGDDRHDHRPSVSAALRETVESADRPTSEK